jgi:hypothetical protein
MIAAPTEAQMIAVRRLRDYGAGDEAEARKTLWRWYPKADPVQVDLIVDHWSAATEKPVVTPEAAVEITVSPIGAGRLVDWERPERETVRVTEET